MLDELPMIYCALILAFCLIQQPHRRARYMPTLPIAMTLHALIATVLVASPALAPEYASPTLQFFAFHISFALLESFLLYKSVMLWRGARERHDSTMERINRQGVLFWSLGIVCWVLDFAGCDRLWEGEQSWRVRYLTGTVALPTAWLADGTLQWSNVVVGLPNPQLHSWWHIFAVRRGRRAHLCSCSSHVSLISLFNPPPPHPSIHASIHPVVRPLLHGAGRDAGPLRATG